jgi:hypothetical protein
MSEGPGAAEGKGIGSAAGRTVAAQRERRSATQKQGKGARWWSQRDEGEERSSSQGMTVWIHAWPPGARRTDPEPPPRRPGELTPKP